MTTRFTPTEWRSLLDHHVAGQGVAGLAVRVGDEATVVWTPADRPEEPRFLAYSITKSFTAVLLLRLQETGRLALDAPLAGWFPAVPAANRITLRQLLNHTAGLPDYGALPAYQTAVRDTPSRPWSFAQFAAATYERGLLFEPGTGWAYANPGFMLLKAIAERVSGRSFAALVEDIIARPLGLRRTSVAEEIAALADLAPAPSRAISPNGRPRDTRRHYHPGWVSHGVVAAPASEIAAFYVALFDGRLLWPHSLREMTALVDVPDAPPQWRAPGYGLGLMGDPGARWGAILGHGGAGPGYTSAAFHAPALGDAGVTVAALCAVEDGALAETLVFAALDRLARAGP